MHDGMGVVKLSIAAQWVTAVRRPLTVHHNGIDITSSTAQIMLYFAEFKVKTQCQLCIRKLCNDNTHARMSHSEAHHSAVP